MHRLLSDQGGAQGGADRAAGTIAPDNVLRKDRPFLTGRTADCDPDGVSAASATSSPMNSYPKSGTILPGP